MNRWYRYRHLRFGFIVGVLAVFVVALLSVSSLNLLAQGGPWEGKYYNNRDLSGTPVLVRQDAAIDFDWGGGSPAPQVNADNFSVEWTQTANLQAGVYRFTATTDDGMRVFVDNVLVIDSWYDSQVHTISADVYLSAGNHFVKVQYYEAGGVAVAKMNYALVGSSQQPPPTGVWFNEYFTNTGLVGPPALTGTTSAINFNWGFGSPAPGFPADFFSVRWVRSIPLDAGRYRFTVTSDDGVRVWVNNVLIIDQWKIQAPTTYSAELDVPTGNVPVKVEYFEQTERAEIVFNWTRVSAPPPPPPPPPSSTQWLGEFYANMSLSGSPGFTQTSPAVNYNWGFGSPAPNIPADNFSAKFTSVQSLAAGQYRFTVTVDDGARLYVNNQLLIDAWYDGAVRTYTANYTSPGGPIPIRLEYYENLGRAEVSLTITPLSGTGGPFPGTATVTSYKLNVRRGPGTNFAIITKLNNGQTVPLTGYRNGDATWVQVALGNGVTGWVSSLYITTTVPISSLTPLTPSTPAPPPPGGTQATGVVIASALNVRTGPGVEYPAYTTIGYGTTVWLLGRNAAATWVKVVLPDGRQGWVSAAYLQTSVPVVNLPVLAN